tara:strand:- start:321 stop:635 length:315 start_codon:yes stop_codon:yes gene_type:complete
MYESDPAKVREAFYPNAKITGYIGTGLAEMSVDDFASFVESQQPSPKDKQEEILLEILSCELAGSTACVRVRDGYIGNVYLDTLSFLKKDGEWKIYNKLFHIES